MVVFLLHSAEAQVLALLVRWEIMNATFDRSVGNAWGKNSKWMEQSMRNVLHDPGSPVYGVGSANLHGAPLLCVGGAWALVVGGGGAATPDRASCPRRSCSWDERWPMLEAMAVWISPWRMRKASWVRRFKIQSKQHCVRLTKSKNIMTVCLTNSLAS